MVLRWWLIGCWVLVIRIILCSCSFFMKFKISYQFLIQIPLNISTESGMEKLILSPKKVCSWIQVLGMPKRQRRISTLSTFKLLSSNQGFSLISWCCSLHFQIFMTLCMEVFNMFVEYFFLMYNSWSFGGYEDHMCFLIFGDRWLIFVSFCGVLLCKELHC
jgi:hypothetical protein